LAFASSVKIGKERRYYRHGRQYNNTYTCTVNPYDVLKVEYLVKYVLRRGGQHFQPCFVFVQNVQYLPNVKI